MRAFIALGLMLGTTASLAQESASFMLQEQAFNAGGHPSAGLNPASASHRVTLGSIGEPVALGALAGPTMRLSGGFVAPYPPPGEVLNLLFSLPVTLAWSPEASAGRYNLYRGTIASLPGLGYGACTQQDIPTSTTSDATVVPLGTGVFYLVTVENRLGEEGTKGYTSGGIERLGLQCP